MLMPDKTQKQLLWICFICYVTIYLAKFNYNALMVEIIDSMGVTKAAAGLVGTFFFAAYGISQFVHAAFIKKYNLRLVVGSALLCSGLCNLLMTVVGSVSAMKYIWFLNGVSCSFLWCGMFGEMSKYLSFENSRRSIIIMGLTPSIGTTVNYLLCAVITEFAFWKLSFYIAFAVTACTATLWFTFVGNIEKKYVPIGIKPKEEKQEEKQRLTKGIVICLGVFFVAGALIQFIRDGMTAWVPTLLYELYSVPKTLSIVLTLGLPLVGALSNIMVVLLERKIKSFTVLYVLFTGGTSLSLGVLMSVYGAGVVPLTLFLFVFASFTGSGVGAIVTSHLPVYYKRYFNAGALAGLSNGSAYVGSMFSTYTLGLISDHGGWDAVFTTLFIVATTAFVLVTMLLIGQASTKDKSAVLIEE